MVAVQPQFHFLMATLEGGTVQRISDPRGIITAEVPGHPRAFQKHDGYTLCGQTDSGTLLPLDAALNPQPSPCAPKNDTECL